MLEIYSQTWTWATDPSGVKLISQQLMAHSSNRSQSLVNSARSCTKIGLRPCSKPICTWSHGAKDPAISHQIVRVRIGKQTKIRTLHFLWIHANSYVILVIQRMECLKSKNSGKLRIPHHRRSFQMGRKQRHVIVDMRGRYQSSCNLFHQRRNKSDFSFEFQHFQAKQTQRGGGTVCRYSKAVADAYRTMITDFEPCTK